MGIFEGFKVTCETLNSLTVASNSSSSSCRSAEYLRNFTCKSVSGWGCGSQRGNLILRPVFHFSEYMIIENALLGKFYWNEVLFQTDLLYLITVEMLGHRHCSWLPGSGFTLP